MGLDIAVGWLASQVREEGEGELAELTPPFDLLNEVLAEAGMAPHHEPLDVPEDQVFEAQMWGYGGLHAIRRLAAYYALERRLPPQLEHGVDASEDPVLAKLYREHDRRSNAERRKWLAKWLSPSPPKPSFQHLLWHSDCEGFYLPRVFADVVLDEATPQREGLGAMVGSAASLLEECRVLADLIDLPEGIDPEDDRLWASADSPSTDGPLWTCYGVEAFGLARLIRGCELALRHNAVLMFT
jgi:hypothetical protein